MVIVKLIGGLGNQMFQYAAGRRLAQTLGVSFKLDISGFESYKLRRYSLGHFNIQEVFATPAEVELLTSYGRGTFGLLAARVFQKSLEHLPTHIREKNRFRFDPELLNLPDGVYLEGSWQNERYFQDIKEILGEEFKVKSPQTGKNKEVSEDIGNCEAVSIHIRRGDYISNAKTKEFHGICAPDYYCKCIEEIFDKVKNPHFFLFSDDSKWVLENMKFPQQTSIISHNGIKDYEDMRLMSQCKHHIIANSTFSWWAAWLGQHPDKIIFAPKRWLKSNKYDSKDLIPESWIKV